MFLQNFFLPFKNNVYLFVYLILIFGFLGILLTIVSKQIQDLIQKERRFSNLQKQIQITNEASSAQYIELGILLLNKKLFEQAIKYFKLAIYNCDDIILLGNIYNNIGYCYFMQRNFSLANYYYEEALIYLPDYLVALNNLAFLFETKKEYSTALSLYNKSYEFDSNNPITIKQIEKLKKRIQF